jgi:hypothetical protein
VDHQKLKSILSRSKDGSLEERRGSQLKGSKNNENEIYTVEKQPQKPEDHTWLRQYDFKV